MPTYTRSNFYDDIQRDASGVTNIDRIVNRAVRYVISDIDVRSTKRRSYLTPYLNDEQNDYQAPNDLKEWGIIDIRRIADRQRSDKFQLVTTEYFDRNKTLKDNLVCIEDQNFLKKIRLSAYLRDKTDQIAIHNCDSIDENGTWSVSPDASGLNLDSQMFLEGDASLRFTMDSGGTTTVASGVIINSTMDAVNITTYSNIFVGIYAPKVYNLDGFTLRVGNDASNYLSKQVTTTNEGLAFQTGWLLLRFDLGSATETGSFDPNNVDYIRLAIDRDTGQLNSDEWRLDHIIARKGVPHEIWYYSRFGWQTNTGTYKENSSANTDLINCDTEEYELYILKGKELLAEDLKEFDDADRYRKRYGERKEEYQSKSPSERLLLIQRYYEFGSRNRSTDFTDII